MIVALAVAFASALLSAGAWVFFLKAVQKEQRVLATLWDMVIVASALVVIYLWGEFDQAPAILVARVLGSGLGTFVTMTWRRT